MKNLANYIAMLFKKNELLEVSQSGRTVFIECTTEEQAEELLSIINDLSPEIETD